MKRGRRRSQEQDEEQETTVDISSLKKLKKRKKDAEKKRIASDGLDDGEERDEHNITTGMKKKKKKKESDKRKEIEEEVSMDNVREDIHTEEMALTEEEESMQGRRYTVSIALPGSIVDNAQTKELKTYLAGQIARAAVVFCIDEIIVFNEHGTSSSTTQGEGSDCNVFLARLLEYQETPQYLRKALFPMHRDLKFAGLLNPLDCPHHMRADDVCLYREGVVSEPTVIDGSKKRQRGPLVDCGMRQKVVIDKSIETGTRVTVKLDSQAGGGKYARGKAVSPSVPRTYSGLYWGYTVRLANSFSSVFTHGPHKGGYDLTIGTSERGESVDQLTTLPSFNHLLIVFGGLKGLEYSLECDDSLKIGKDVSLLFHHYLNTCPSQGSRTIRTEEALLISLAALRPLITKNTN